MKIGIYPGSFNPIHKGHIKIINHLLQKNLDLIIVIPTGNYWNKQNLEVLEDRLNMAKTYENSKIIIDSQRNNMEYTYQILESLSKEYPQDQLYLIMGADNVINLEKWKNIDQILTYPIIVINRDDIALNEYINKLNHPAQFIIINDLEKLDISSTQIRNEIKKHHSLKSYLDKPVIDYIMTKHLYQ